MTIHENDGTRTGAAAARKKRVGQESSATRTALLDAAEQLMQEEGYAAVTTRRLGAKAGVQPPLIHYYFQTMDDLFVALFRRRAEEGLKQAAKALEAERPLRALWELSTDPSGVVLNLEFMALGNHRKVIRAELGAYGERLRKIGEEALARHFAALGIEPQITPATVDVLMTSVARILVLESLVGITGGHADTEALVEAALLRFETTGDALPALAAGFGGDSP
jgi:AcrR family transcriptional regulator